MEVSMKMFLWAVVLGALFTQMPTCVYCETNSLIGEWEVVSQVPSQKELLSYTKKPAGFEGVNNDDVVVPETKQTVTITENNLINKTVGEGVNINDEEPYKLEGDKIIMIPPEGEAAESPFYVYAKQFIPAYTSFKFDGENLILTTSEIPGYQNKTITKVLKRIK